MNIRVGGWAIGAACLMAGCGRGAASPAARPSLRDAVVCSQGSTRLTLPEGWSCFQPKERGRPRGLGAVPTDASGPGALLVSEALPFSTDGLRSELLARVRAERGDLLGRYRRLGQPTSETAGRHLLCYVEGEPKKIPGALRREGYVASDGFCARFIQITPSGGSGTVERRRDLDALIGSLRFGN